MIIYAFYSPDTKTLRLADEHDGQMTKLVYTRHFALARTGVFWEKDFAQSVESHENSDPTGVKT